MDALTQAQEAFEQACKARWGQRANEEDRLVQARERLLDADDETRFTSRYQEGYQERREALAKPLEVLTEAGEAGIPHLGVRLNEDSWASVLAVEALAEMPSSPLRDRTIVEALFTPGEWRNDTATRASQELDSEAAWTAFEQVVRQASRDGVELQHFFWTVLFEDEPATLNQPLRPGPRFGDALELLYEEGHLAALGDGLFHVLDPSLDGPESVRAFLDDGSVQAAIETIRASEPQRVNA